MNTIISQAMAIGLPVITTNHSGLPEQVLDGVNGAIVPESDPEALAQSIVWFLSHPEQWPDFSRAARLHVASRYDSKRMIDLQISCYAEMLER
jgi:colanic acid/amylovoran biosynthesis glycosyltransferase